MKDLIILVIVIISIVVEDMKVEMLIILITTI